MENDNYKVYVHINKTNNKKYVGITKQEPSRRWQNGRGYYNKDKTNYFYNAILKYGWDGFEHIILLEGLDEKTAKEKEQYYIKLYNSNHEEYGYNLTNGGDGFSGMKRSEETKRKISESLKGKYTGENSYWFGRNIPQEMIEKQKETKRNNPYHHTEGWKIQHSLDMARENNPNARKVRCTTTGEIFNCVMDASEYYSIDNSGICKCCIGKQKYAGRHPETNEKMIWEYII